jgi:hypothetical protein
VKRIVISMVACLVAVTACGQIKKNRKDILHAPDQLLVQTPLNLAGTGLTDRDEAQFQACLANPQVMAACSLPYLDLPDAPRAAQVDQVLAHTLISHDWQKERFRSFLLETRPELISMLSCVKGIAISTDIRPSFYYPPSGAIYLDARYFAGNEEEAKTVSTRPDARQDNYNQISLLFFTVGTAIPETLEEARRLDLEGLLAHELTHACDFKAQDLTGHYVSEALPEAPHNAAYYLAQWLFFGNAQAKAELETFTPAEIGRSYEESPIVDIYGYGNRFEHLAMMVQSHLTFEFSGNNRVDLLTDNPKADERLRDFPIHWGMTGKFCQPHLFEEGRAMTARTVPMPMEFQKSGADCTSVVHEAGRAVYEVLGLPRHE